MLSINEAKQKVIDTAATNKAFREMLLEDQQAAFKNLFNTDLPAGIKVKVHQETPDELHIVLPSENDNELSDIELEAVSGGICWLDDAPAGTRAMESIN